MGINEKIILHEKEKNFRHIMKEQTILKIVRFMTINDIKYSLIFLTLLVSVYLHRLIPLFEILVDSS